MKRVCNRRNIFKRSDFTEDTPFFIPKDPSSNDLRHFGQHTEYGLILRENEIRYLCGEQPSTMEERVYFDLKDDGFNILYEDDASVCTASIYRRNKHFNRKKNDKIGNIHFVGKDSLFDVSKYTGEAVNVFAVEGWNDYCLIQIKMIERPSKEIDRKLLKKNESSS